MRATMFSALLLLLAAPTTEMHDDANGTVFRVSHP